VRGCKKGGEGYFSVLKGFSIGSRDYVVQTATEQTFPGELACNQCYQFHA